MKQTTTLLLSCMAGLLAINLSLADEKQDVEMASKMKALTEENVSLTERLYKMDAYGMTNRENEIYKTEEKIKSDLRVVTERFFREEMGIDVSIQDKFLGEFQVTIAVSTNLEREFYPELIDLIEKTVSMKDVHVLVVEKNDPAI